MTKVTVKEDFAINGMPQFVAGTVREVEEALLPTLLERGLVEPVVPVVASSAPEAAPQEDDASKKSNSKTK